MTGACPDPSRRALPGRASAQVCPYAASGRARFVSQTDFVGSGYATHLGLYTEVGSVSFTPVGNTPVLNLTGVAVYTAANGAELHALLAGQLDTVTGAFTATVSHVGGTGRFADASGSATLLGQMQGGGAATVAVAGTIEY